MLLHHWLIVWLASRLAWVILLCPANEVCLLYSLPQEDSSPDYLIKAEECLRNEVWDSTAQKSHTAG